MDFVKVFERSKKGYTEIYPKFIVGKSNDLMIRGSDFYAIWDKDKNLWSTEETDAIQLIDNELAEYAENYKKNNDIPPRVLYLWDADNGYIDKWHKFCQKQMPDNYHILDEKLIFSNTKVSKRDYASRRLPYPLEECPIDSYDRLMSVLYSEEERHKIEWAIGAIVTGDSKTIQKFMVLYGAAGTGKSTVLNIVQMLFDGYYNVFDAKALGSSSNSFALEAFKSNPLVAIQHDGDLSHIEDNTRLNSLVSHELMTVNEKFKSTYSNRFRCFLFMGTNRPVKITDAKSGLIRRLIDVSPSGNRVSLTEYKQLIKQITFELGGIAYHCREVYLDDPNAYDDYIPKTMLGASNDFYNFIAENYFVFKNSEYTSLKQAWEMYKTYCEEAKVMYPYPQRQFKEELKNYFEDYQDRYSNDDGSRVRSVYIGFKTEKFETSNKSKEDVGWLHFNRTRSLLDKEFADFKAQYANDHGTPKEKWANVTTKLSDIDTSKLHYVQVPINQIVIDFDIKDKNGEKSYIRNLEEANKWPPTYAELSKSGAGIHLHYIYEGDPKKLANVYADDIEIKVFTGDSSLRRMLTKCNGMKISTINSGLPLKEEKNKVATINSIKSEKQLRNLIEKNLRKEIHPGTKPSIDFIKSILDEAYASGLKYDVSNMKTDIFNFAAGSTHHSKYCTDLVLKMKFKSEDITSETEFGQGSDIVFFDVEVFPNLFVCNWKYRGKDKVFRMINPDSAEIEKLLTFKLVGFNCRRYDNHILYARLMGYTNEQLYNLSQRIVNGDKNAFFSEAYNLSYTDVYDFTSLKQSLKKYEIELGIHHQELGLPWDKPVAEELWTKVAEYCDNDVIATEAVFEARSADFTARQILAYLAGGSVNDTTNSLTTTIIFGKNRNPQDCFNYRDLSKPVEPCEESYSRYGYDNDYHIFDSDGNPTYKIYNPSMDGYQKFPKGYSILPFFPGYVYDKGESTYLNEIMGEGGRVYSKPGHYGNVWDGDVSSMHPHSIKGENLFGKYTVNFISLLDARIYIKHKEFAKAKRLFDGKLSKYLTDENTAKQLSGALKIAINSVYGLTSANFDNPFRDLRNVDNIVAKRGALFMTKLKHEVEKRGFTVAHIKTDSIKIPDANKDIQDFVIKFGKEYGYDFETEAEFDKFCLVNDAVYVGKLKDGSWTATGTQFQVPYVFKTLFSKEEIVFSDLCETKSVSKGDLYLDMNETIPEGEHNYQFVGKTGLFCPIKPGKGGGVLYRINEGKPYAAAGTKGFRWLESEVVRVNKKEDDIDISYYESLVEDAKKTISKFGSYEDLVSDKPYKPPVYLTNEYGMEAPAFHVDELPF